jgi:hypothetical protein
MMLYSSENTKGEINKINEIISNILIGEQTG